MNKWGSTQYISVKMADTCMGAKILPVDNIIFSAVLHGVFLAKLTIHLDQ